LAHSGSPGEIRTPVGGSLLLSQDPKPAIQGFISCLYGRDTCCPLHSAEPRSPPPGCDIPGLIKSTLARRIRIRLLDFDDSHTPSDLRSITISMTGPLARSRESYRFSLRLWFRNGEVTGASTRQLGFGIVLFDEFSYDPGLSDLFSSEESEGFWVHPRPV